MNSQPETFLLGRMKCSRVGISSLLDSLKMLLLDKALHPRTVNYLNAHIFNLAFHNTGLTDALNESYLVAADGVSIVWASRLLGHSLNERCNMTETFRSFLDDSSFPRSTGVVIGGSFDEVKLASANIMKVSRHCVIQDAFSGFMDMEAYVLLLQKYHDVDFVFIGMGSPKSEMLAQRVAKVLPCSIVWHIGGGTIQFFAGTSKEAPVWMRQTGLQWMHRLLLEPRRMWKRYLIGNLLFISRIIRLRYSANTVL
jgi:N-acetylglucosaminyldiphosphoundecaprenol N-acetyl-beta-D-mannosaminyltransferase